MSLVFCVFVGEIKIKTGYFDAVQNTIQQGNSSTVVLKDSTETAQF
jgi:isocitrate lyase